MCQDVLIVLDASCKIDVCKKRSVRRDVNTYPCLLYKDQCFVKNGCSTLAISENTMSMNYIEL